jgi:hypothetical protein
METRGKRKDARLVVVPLCTDPVEELSARTEVEAEVEVMGGLVRGAARDKLRISTGSGVSWRAMVIPQSSRAE